MKHKLLSFFVGGMILTSVAFAQEKKVSGRVTGADGKPLAGVTIAVQGSSVATQTDANGNYSLSVPTGKVIVFRSVGYTDTTLIVKEGQSSFNVTLDNNDNELEEVVVTGYGVRQIKDMVGSQSSIKGKALAAEANVSFDQALSGKVAGVQIGTTGGTLGDGISVRVRGVNSISSSSLPLYVIDGVPMNTVENVSELNSGNGARFNPLSMINSADIESIEVLKDAGASVLYGSRAANGVVMITTKRGKKGFNTVNFESKFISSRASKLVSLLNGDQFIQINNEKAANAASRFGGTATIIAKESDLNGDGVNDRTNWLDEVYRRGTGFDNNVSFSGGTESVNYFASARYNDQRGILIGNDIKTGQARMNLDLKVNNWFKSGISLSFAKTKNNGVLTDRYISGATVAALNAFPTVSPYSQNNEYGYNLNGTGYLGLGNNVTVLNGTGLTGNIANPLSTTNLQYNQNTPEQLLSNIYGEITFMPGLKFTSKFGIDYLKNYEHQYSHPAVGGLGFAYNGLTQDYFRDNNLWVWQNYINYDKSIGESHRISATVGSEYNYSKQKLTYAGASNISDPYFTDIIDGTYTGTVPGTEDVMLLSGGDLFSTGLESYFGRVGYSYKSKYLLEAAFRADAFSAFGVNNKWGYFPSVSAGWVVSEEDFIKSADWLSYLKLRGSYGKVGNSRGINAYAARTLYQGGAYASENGFSAYQLGNADLKWETTKKFDVGVDFKLADNKYGFVIDYFNNDISGLVLDATPLYSVGVPRGSIFTNIGSMYNRGLEFTFTMETIKKENFTWTTALNFTAIKNRVTALVTNNTDFPSGNNVASVNRRLGEFKLLQWAGVDEQTGNPMFYDKEGVRKTYNPSETVSNKRWTLDDGSVTSAITANDAVYTGESGIPKYYGGLDNNFTYKNFDLGISLVYTGGFSVYNSTRANLLTNNFLNNDTEILDRWTTPGQKTDVPRLFLLDNVGNQASDRFLEKGDFLRCRTINLGYTFKDLDKIGINSVRVYGQVYNAFIITGYSGQDPEVNSNRNNTNIAIGVDSRAVPQPRTYTFGLSLTLR